MVHRISTTPLSICSEGDAAPDFMILFVDQQQGILRTRNLLNYKHMQFALIKLPFLHTSPLLIETTEQSSGTFGRQSMKIRLRLLCVANRTTIDCKLFGLEGIGLTLLLRSLVRIFSRQHVVFGLKCSLTNLVENKSSGLESIICQDLGPEFGAYKLRVPALLFQKMKRAICE